jgi:hypothetical protein
MKQSDDAKKNLFPPTNPFLTPDPLSSRRPQLAIRKPISCPIDRTRDFFFIVQH